MKSFDYVRAASVEDALRVAAWPGSVFLAGGTNLVDLMKVGVAEPVRVVDITALPGLNQIDYRDDGSVQIGALVKNADLAHSPPFQANYPSIAEALLSGASAQLRNVATVGGNLLQRTRCSYFFDLASACNKRVPASGCDALDGENSNHAVLGWSRSCIATHPSDFAVALMSLDAIVEIAGPQGKRSVALESFYVLPLDQPDRETQLAAGELVTGVVLPPDASAFSQHSRYLKVRERTSFAFAVVSVAASLVVRDGLIEDARLALGGVAATPWRARAAETSLREQPVTDAAFRAAAEIALGQARPSGHNGYKIELARRLVVRALRAAATKQSERPPALPGSVFSTAAGGRHA